MHATTTLHPQSEPAGLRQLPPSPPAAWRAAASATLHLWAAVARPRDGRALVLLLALWIAGPCNLVLWQRLLALPSPPGTGAFVALAALIGGGTLLLCGPFINGPSWRFAVAAMALVSAAATHFMQQYGVVIDPGMITNAAQTDLRETRDLINLPMLWTLLWTAMPPALLALQVPVRPHRRRDAFRRSLTLMLAGLALAVSGVLLNLPAFGPLMRSEPSLRYAINPFSTLYSAARAATRRADRNAPLAPVGLDARLGAGPSDPPPLLVLVLGETTRSSHFGLNGYPRDTTPRLAALTAAGEAVISTPDVLSCGTSTATSLPCMFSHAGRDGYARLEQPHENLLDVLKRAGLTALWLDNQSGCKGVCDRIEHDSTVHDRGLTGCGTDDDGCDDRALLTHLQQRLHELTPAERSRGVVAVLHMMGSHGPAYFKRSAASLKAFAPECTQAALGECPRDSVINAYDNSIRATDALLADTIEWLRPLPGFRSMLLFIGDHGESLGEGGLYLHGMPWAIAPDVQKRVPWIEWQSAAAGIPAQADLACLRSQRGLSHDHLFHSVLGMVGVTAREYRPELDRHRACAASAA